MISLVLSVIFSFSSCSGSVFQPGENLIRPPKLSGADGELEAAFEDVIAKSGKGDYILRYPSSGDYRSAFVIHDCNGDGKDEAFVFYSYTNEEMSVHMAMFGYDGKKWQHSGDVVGEGNDVSDISFSDLNNDSVDEVFVGWSGVDRKINKTLTVYCSHGSGTSLEYKAAANETYTSLYSADIDNDSENELLLFTINSTSDDYSTYVSVFKLKRDGDNYMMRQTGTANLFNGVTSFNNIVSDKKDGVTRVFVDETASDSYLTEILYWDADSDSLVLPVKVSSLTLSKCPTARSLDLESKDIDGDSVIEIPTTNLLADSRIIYNNTEESTTSESYSGDETSQENSGRLKQKNTKVYLTSWLDFDGGKFNTVASYVENETDEYRFSFNGIPADKFSVMIYPNEHLTQFGKKGTDGKFQILFSVEAYETTDDVLTGNYLLSGDNYKYFYEITDEGRKEGISSDYIMNRFSVDSSDIQLTEPETESETETAAEPGSKPNRFRPGIFS